MLLRLPNGLAVEPILIRKKFIKWQDEHPSSPASCSMAYGIPAHHQLMISGGDVKAVQGNNGYASANLLVNTYAHIQQDSRKSWVKSLRKASSTSREQHLCRLPRLKQNRPSPCRHCWNF